MAEKRRKNKWQQEEPEPPTKEEYKVADFMRFNVPTKEGKLRGMPVTYFIASKAVDALLDSKWATTKGKTEALFTTRGSCVDYCDRLLIKGLFHRAARVEKKKDKEKKLKKLEGKDEKEKGKKTKKKEEKEVPEKSADEESKEKKDQKSSDKKDEDKKKKKKIKLEMHNSQKFVDGDEVYVWIHDPTPLQNKIIGLVMVLGAIAVCLFPLWPPEVRLGVYYISLAAATFVGFILSLCIVRFILFCIVWGLTFGKHHFWFLPNLTEDVGFFDSFKPLYKHDVCTGESKSKEGSEENSDDVKKDEDESAIKSDKNSQEDNNTEDGAQNEDFEKSEKETIGEDEQEDKNERNSEDSENSNEDDDIDLLDDLNTEEKPLLK